MKNGISLLFCLFIFVAAGFTQNTQLTIEGTRGKFYLKHIVVAKENWYSIGRLFNQSPKDIANYNNLNFDKPLEVGQQINVPLTAVNFDQKQKKSSGETLVPVYHIVGEGEWMFKISSIYNDVPVTSLEKWNNIKRDNVKVGTPLIIGYLKVKTDLSPLAMGISSNPAGGNPSAVTAPVPNSVSQSSNKPAPVPPVNTASQTADKPITVTTPATASSSSQTPAKPASQTISNPAAATTNSNPVNSSAERVNNYAATHSNGGFFSIDYAGGNKSASGMAGTFKSTSGWTDGKYYALMNNVAVGTIIRLNASNGKTIYAKVLGQLPEMKESNGLLIRISNAASAELGLGEGKFAVDIKY